MNTIKYLENGQRVLLIAELETGGYLVKAHEGFFEEGDWESGLPDHSWFSTPFWVNKVYDAPLLEKLRNEAESLKEEIKALRKEKSEIIRKQERELSEERKAWNKRIEKLGKYSSLIDDMGLMLEGKITHVALLEDSYKKYYKVEEWNDAKYYKASRYRENFRMLSIQGYRDDKKGLLKSFSFRLKDYDGMSSCEVLFATSKEDAEKKIKSKLEELAISQNEYRSWFVKKCEEFGIELTGTKFDLYLKEQEEEARKREVEKNRKREQLERQLAELK